jgi:trehalose 6-phosphate synthase
MNLVAKEFAAARDDEQGVLVLSPFAGASRELHEALSVNPYDAHAIADTLARALSMPPDEQRWRLAAMRQTVARNNVYRWAALMLQDAGRARART